MATELTPRDAEFVDMFAGFFHDILRAAGITMLPTKSHDRIRQIAHKFATSIEWRAEHKAVEVIRILQAAVVKSFEHVEGDVTSLKDRVLELEAKVEALTKRTD